MTQLRLLLAVLALVLGMRAAEADIKVGVAAEPFPPFSMKDSSGQWTGWEIELLHAVCAHMNEKCEIVEVAWDGILPALEARHFDMIWSAMSITPERREQIAFSNYYYKTSGLIVGARNGDMDITPTHFGGKTIGVQMSTVAAKYAEKFYVPAGASIKTYATQDEALQDLAAGRIDITLASAAVLADFLGSETGKACCELKGKVPDDPILGEGIAAGLRKEDTALKTRVDTAIAVAAKAGDFDRITAKHPELKNAITYPQP